MKKPIDAFDYAGHICKSLQTGVLLTTKAGDTVNTMTIGWGHLGIEWNKPIFVAYVRESRYTRELLDQNGAFTVNIPWDGTDSQLLTYCGRNSGRDTDKIREKNLTLVAPEKINVPGIQELPLTLECQVIYRQIQDPAAIPENLLRRFYPKEGPNDDRDIHIAYYGEILSAYLIAP